MSLTPVANYRRRIGASLGRVWENVRDWEHLPWLHRESFASIALEEEGAFGWRAAIGLRDAARSTIRLELVRDGEHRYVSRTIEGPGAGGEIWTRLAPVDTAHTDIEVEFLAPGVDPARRDAVGAGFVKLYTLLWDQDEAMMQRRSRLLDGPRVARAAPPAELDLGAVAEVEARLPLRVELGGRAVVVARDAAGLVAFDALCPHRLGPLDEGAIAEGRVVCPWHGYAFELRSGRGCGAAARMRLAPAPRVALRGGRVALIGAGRA